MNAELLLSHLQHVRKSGPDSWRADCPNPVHQHGAHGGLSITATSDGTLLLKCFSCGDVRAILAALGLELADLFPERIKDTSPEGRQRAREAFRRSGWAAALRVLSREATVVLAAAGMLRQGHALTADDEGRLRLAMQRIEDARAVLA